ncbi:MAG: MurR/RpiR family transcriptional regulator [Synergistaceae bacterium]|jgi:DNA-binding MurR/RpiR family transcriptional regulator|nr:MurR/RpiR family transcriptional regulator [Synergistaceae bacterium]
MRGKKAKIGKSSTGSQFDAGNSHLLAVIKNNYSSMSSAHQKIALYVKSNPGKVIHDTARQISEETGVSEATVVRFCRALGFVGFSDFKLRLAQDIVGSEKLIAAVGIGKHDTPEEILSKSMASHIDDIKFMMSTLRVEKFKMAVDMLAKAERIAFFSIGGSFPVAYDAYWHFAYIGKQASAPTDVGAQIMLAQSLGSRDVAFAISMSGQSKAPCLCLSIARKNGAPTISLTQNIKAEIQKYSDCSLIVHKREENNQDLPTLSKLKHIAVVEALCMAVTTASWEESMRNVRINAREIGFQQF